MKENPLTQDAESEQQLLHEEQENLAGVDTSIRQSVEAVQIGRDAVAERINPHSSRTANPVQVINAGREQVLQNLLRTAKNLGGQPAPAIERQLTAITDDLTERLHSLTSQSSSADPVRRRIIETQIRAAVASYVSSVQRILNPIQFEAASPDGEPNQPRGGRR